MEKQKKKKSQKSASKSKEKDPKKPAKSKDVEISANENSIKSGKKDKAKKQTKELVLDKSISEISMIAPPVELVCQIHKTAYAYYCQTCQEVICNQCITLAPHNNQYHRIIKMSDAYKQRVFIMSECFRQNLVSKRDRLIQHLQKYERQIEELKNYKQNIEREVRSEYGGFLEKLKLSEGSKSAVLLYEVSTIQKEINGINDLGTKFYELTNMSNLAQGQSTEKNICKFLSKSKQLYAAVEYYLSKPLRPLPNIDIHDLPNQLQNERGLMNISANVPLINSFRDQVICTLINRQQGIKRDFQAKADMMMRNLGEQADILSNRLKQYNVVCVFCGEPMGDNVNSGCSSNSTSSSVLGYQLGPEVPPARMGNNRHFFIEDKNEHLRKTVEI